MANAVALCFFAKNFKYLDLPIVISGKSASSIGGKGALHQHIVRIEDVDHLPKNTKENWGVRIPKYWTGPTIWAQSVLDALYACDRTDKIEDINFKYLYATLLVFNFNDRKQIFREFTISFLNMKFIFISFKISIQRAYVFIYNRSILNNIIRKNNIKNIGEAVGVLNGEFNQKKLPF
jgi:hypothetical protein